MSDALPLIAIGGLVAVVGGGFAYLAYATTKKRNAAMLVVAQTMGFTYEEELDKGALVALVGDTPLFDRGHARKVQRMLRGRLAGRDAAIFDYRYTTGSGRNAHTHRQTVVLFPDGAKGLPDFALAPESVFHALVEIFGAQDIDFDQNPEFSKRYLLKGRDETAIRKVFTSEALAYLAGTPGWTVQAHGGRLVVFHGEKFVTPSEIPGFAADALRIVGMLAPT